MIEQGLSGIELQRALQNHCLRQLSVATLLEQLPHWDNRIQLSQEKKDALGIPRPEIHYQWTSYEEKGLEAGGDFRQGFLRDLSCSRIQSGQSLFGAGHLMGTTRMGNSPKTSVTDSWGRCHDHPNLYLAGSSLFPTGGTSNPTLTLVALAHRTSEKILSDF